MPRRSIVLALLLASATVAAQQPPPTFSTATHLVVQTVAVKDKDGHPVEGLTAADFVVVEDGRAQQIAFVEYQRLDTAPASTVTLAAEPSDRPNPAPLVAPLTAATSVPGDRRLSGRRLLVFYFDLYHDSLTVLHSSRRIQTYSGTRHFLCSM